jgi:hypothetical protein
LFDDGGEALEDIAGFVGHALESTTAGYVKRRGRRAKLVAERAAKLLDAGHDRAAGSGGVRNHQGDGGSSRGSNESGLVATDRDGDEPLPQVRADSDGRRRTGRRR